MYIYSYFTVKSTPYLHSTVSKTLGKSGRVFGILLYLYIVDYLSYQKVFQKCHSNINFGKRTAPYHRI